ncbi:hypothetical protein KEM56_007370 [Ascosphaera pollenicola]|nr:hypothetical protein KEM56_007370 [Ascosphaera pollenicola]
MAAQASPSHKRDSVPHPMSTAWSERESNRLKNVTSIISYCKRSEKDGPTIDLSRTSAEHEGLGIYTSLDSDKSYDPLSPRLNFRTTSGTSIARRRTDPIYSTMRPTSTSNMVSRTKSGTYVHPMRQTPRAHDNPVWSARQKQQEPEEEHFYSGDYELFPTFFQDDITAEPKDIAQSSDQTPLTPQTMPAAKADMRIGDSSNSCGYTSSSTSQSPENEHLTSLPGIPPSAAGSATATTPSNTIYTRDNNSSVVTSVVDVISTNSPKMTGRSSLDGFLLRHGHGKDNGSLSNLRPSSNHHGIYKPRGLRARPNKSEQFSPPQDPAARAALVQAVRQDFEDREAAKDAKIERRNQKAQEREMRRRERMEQHSAKLQRMRRKSPLHEENSSGDNLEVTDTTTPRSPSYSNQPQSVVSYESCGTSRGGSAGTSSNNGRGNAASGSSSTGDRNASPIRRLGFRRNSAPSPDQSNGIGPVESPKNTRWYKWGRKDKMKQTVSPSPSNDALGVDEYLPEKKIYTSPKDAWLWFITWLRTRLFKLARRLKKHRTKTC